MKVLLHDFMAIWSPFLCFLYLMENLMLVLWLSLPSSDVTWHPLWNVSHVFCAGNPGPGNMWSSLKNLEPTIKRMDHHRQLYLYLLYELPRGFLTYFMLSVWEVGAYHARIVQAQSFWVLSTLMNKCYVPLKCPIASSVENWQLLLVCGKKMNKDEVKVGLLSPVAAANV